MSEIRVRRTQPEDFQAIHELSRLVYPWTKPWSAKQLASHHQRFPEGQMVAEEAGQIMGMSASLIVHWSDHDPTESWTEFTKGGFFTDHDPVQGHTLYGAEVMVHPQARGHGVGHLLYDARKALVRQLGLRRIRAGSRLSGYGPHAPAMSAQEYVDAVVSGKFHDPILSFQLEQGFQVFAVLPHYLWHDPYSLGWAALIEWMNPEFRGRG